MSLKKKERNKTIIELIHDGKTCEEVGEVFGVTKQRAHHIFWEDGAEKAKKRNPVMFEHLKKRGCTNKDITISIFDGH